VTLSFSKPQKPVKGAKVSTLLSTPSTEGCEATKIVKGLRCPILILRKTLLSKVKSVVVSAWTDRRFKKNKKKGSSDSQKKGRKNF
jgi:hypothetical protein